jgi:hypothetical protein
MHPANASCVTTDPTAYARGIPLYTAQPEQTSDALKPVYAFRRKGLDDFCTCKESRYLDFQGMPNLYEVAIFYRAAPPAQVPDAMVKKAIKLLELFNDPSLPEHSGCMSKTSPAQTPERLTETQNRKAFEEFVKSEMGDIAVMDAGRYISPKIQNYWRVWEAASSKH